MGLFALALLSALAISGSAAHGDDVVHLPQFKRDGIDRTHLFKRQAGAANNYPPFRQLGPTPQPAWLNAYNNAKAAGLIPALPIATAPGAYPAGANLTAICSWSNNQCYADDFHNAPDGVQALAFDDGPVATPSPILYSFLEQQNQTATHFMIGSEIMVSEGLFTRALDDGHSIGVHTWSHPPMTTLNDTAIVGELGWTLQIIADLSGGLLPSIWRPPYGDTDNRVRAIAEHVFGLRGVIWNHDSFDWCLNDAGVSSCAPSEGGPANPAALLTGLDGFASGPKSPGLVLLEHELSLSTVNGFIQAYPQFKSAGWNILNVPEAFSIPWYQNKPQPNNPIQSMTIGVLASYGVKPTTSSSSSIAQTSTAGVAATRSASLPSAVVAAPAHQNSSDGSVNVGAIAGAAAGGVVLGLLALVLLCCARRRGWLCFGSASSRPNKRGYFEQPSPDLLSSERFGPVLSGANSRSSLLKEEPSSIDLPGLVSYNNRHSRFPSASQFDIFKPYTDATPPITPREEREMSFARAAAPSRQSGIQYISQHAS